MQMLSLLTSDPDGRSDRASDKARTAVDRVARLVRERCGALPEEMRELQRGVLRLTESPLGATRLARMERAFDRWTVEVGARRSPMAGASQSLRSCERLGEDVRAGFAVWWDHVPGGRRWWVQLVMENDTAQRRWVGLGGTMWATGLIHPRVHPPVRDDRGGTQLRWGGSSADGMSAAPKGTTTRRVGVTEFVRTTSDGEVYGVRPEVYLYAGGRSCSLPVPRLN